MRASVGGAKVWGGESNLVLTWCTTHCDGIGVATASINTTVWSAGIRYGSLEYMVSAGSFRV